MAWVSVAAIGVSAVSAGYGAVKSGQANKANEKLLNKQTAENEADYGLNGQRDFLDTSAAKGAVKVQKESLQDTRKNIAGRSAITGATDEANVAMNTGATRSYNDSISRIAGYGTDFQQRERGLYKQNMRTLYGQKMALNSQKAESAANLAANAGDILSSVALTSGLGKTETAKGVEGVSGGSAAAGDTGGLLKSNTLNLGMEPMR